MKSNKRNAEESQRFLRIFMPGSDSNADHCPRLVCNDITLVGKDESRSITRFSVFINCFIYLFVFFCLFSCLVGWGTSSSL